MGAQDGKKVWFETASIWQLLKYFGKLTLILISIGIILGAIFTIIAYETDWYQKLASAVWVWLTTTVGGVFAMCLGFSVLAAFIYVKTRKGGARQK